MKNLDRIWIYHGIFGFGLINNDHAVSQAIGLTMVIVGIACYVASVVMAD